MAARAAVRQTIERYRLAYEQLDVDAAVRVWPSADRRALSRAFRALESQGLVLEPCEISLAASRATALCDGVMVVAPKIGASNPARMQRRWTFDMREGANEWRIEQVTTSERPPDPQHVDPNATSRATR